MTARRICPCGALSAPGKGLCTPCAARRKATRNAHAPAARTAVSAHRATVGDWCPGYRRPAHAASDLTAEHGVPISRGGVVDGVLCRSCNSSKGAT